jgi:methanethiol S-methyltransferase
MIDSLKIRAYATIIAAKFLGGTSLLYLCFFLLLGPIRVVHMGLSTVGVLMWDGALCLAFFLQHSGMVRKSFQRRLEAILPAHYNRAVYAIASGTTLFILLLLWQPSHLTLISVHGPFRWLLRGFYFGGILGFVWGVRALGSFDGFGAGPIKAAIGGKPLRAAPFAIRGPYRWVRHPLYAFSLVLLWSYPDLTSDRLLLNLLWTIWIFIGAHLEERDLTSLLGESYRTYQQQVPMLLPLHLPDRD